MKTILCEECGCIVPINKYNKEVLIYQEDLECYDINDRIPTITEHKIEDNGVHHIIEKIDKDNILAKHKCIYCHCKFHGKGALGDYFVCNDCYRKEIWEDKTGKKINVHIYGNPGPNDKIKMTEYGDNIDIEKVNKRGRPKKTNIIKCNFIKEN